MPARLLWFYAWVVLCFGPINKHSSLHSWTCIQRTCIDLRNWTQEKSNGAEKNNAVHRSPLFTERQQLKICVVVQGQHRSLLLSIAARDKKRSSVEIYQKIFWPSTLIAVQEFKSYRSCISYFTNNWKWFFNWCKLTTEHVNTVTCNKWITWYVSRY